MTPVPGDGGPGPVPLAAPLARIGPGRVWYLLPLVVFLGGLAGLVVIFAIRIAKTGRARAAASAPQASAWSPPGPRP